MPYKTKKRDTGSYDYAYIALWNSNRTTAFNLVCKDILIKLCDKLYLLK